MITKDGETSALIETQVNFHHMDEWDQAYKIVIGEFLIAASQWEHVYELLCIDVGLVEGADFKDRLIKADKFLTSESAVAKIKERLSQNPDQDCRKILDFMRDLEAYKETRHLFVHGFHHIYEGAKKIARINCYNERVVEEDAAVDPKVPREINRIVNEINSSRRKVFHGEILPTIVFTTASAVSSQIEAFPLARKLQ